MGLWIEYFRHSVCPESLRRAVESHLEARLTALQREIRLEAGKGRRVQSCEERTQLRVRFLSDWG